MTDPLHQRLAGVTRLSLSGLGPKDAFVFDPHRLALPCWALALQDTGPALLVTLDRHFDLVVPEDVATVPDRSQGLRALDEHARWNLDVRNYDHIFAAMQAGLISDAVVIARAQPRGAALPSEWKDAAGRVHRLAYAKDIDRVASPFDGASQPSGDAVALIQAAERIILDVDLDCFTSPSDADFTEILPWPRELIRRFLMPPDSQTFWQQVLAKTVVLTFAREPAHCGGLIASARLFEDVSEVLFRELLRTDLP